MERVSCTTRSSIFIGMRGARVSGFKHAHLGTNKVHHIAITLGGNDIRAITSPRELAAELTDLVAFSRSLANIVTITSIFPRRENMFMDTEIFNSIAGKTNNILRDGMENRKQYALFLQVPEWITNLYYKDGIHLTDAGYRGLEEFILCEAWSHYLKVSRGISGINNSRQLTDPKNNTARSTDTNSTNYTRRQSNSTGRDDHNPNSAIIPSPPTFSSLRMRLGPHTVHNNEAYNNKAYNKTRRNKPKTYATCSSLESNTTLPPKKFKSKTTKEQERRTLKTITKLVLKMNKFCNPNETNLKISALLENNKTSTAQASASSAQREITNQPSTSKYVDQIPPPSNKKQPANLANALVASPLHTSEEEMD